MARIHKPNEWLVIMKRDTQELRINQVANGYRPPTDDPEYTWGGPYKSKVAAMRAVESKDEALQKQLYARV